MSHAVARSLRGRKAPLPVDTEPTTLACAHTGITADPRPAAHAVDPSTWWRTAETPNRRTTLTGAEHAG
eukprot:15450280-Alexandrium_andersonii.AAC.1